LQEAKCPSGAWGELYTAEQGHSTSNAFRSARNRLPQKSCLRLYFFRSNQSDGEALRIVL